VASPPAINAVRQIKAVFIFDDFTENNLQDIVALPCESRINSSGHQLLHGFCKNCFISFLEGLRKKERPAARNNSRLRPSCPHCRRPISLEQLEMLYPLGVPRELQHHSLRPPPFLNGFRGRLMIGAGAFALTPILFFHVHPSIAILYATFVFNTTSPAEGNTDWRYRF
jgi:hypothetical protein